MMTIELTDQEGQVLGELLDSCLSDLRMEISNTHSYDYRENLKARKTVMEKISAELHAMTH